MRAQTPVRRRLCVLTTASALFLAAAPPAMAQFSADPASLEWTVPPVLPPGALIAVVSRDPTAAGEFTLLVSMPDGYRIPHQQAVLLVALLKNAQT